MRKSHKSKTILPGVCWLCIAGQTHGPPYEDVRIARAAWTETCGSNNELPWVQPGPLLRHLHLDELNIAGFYKPDLFHVYHAGVGKDFAASAIVYAMKTFYKRKNIKESLALINQEIKLYLKETKQSMNFATFTFEMLGYGSARTFPVGHWSKNMDTATVATFAEHLCIKNAIHFPDDMVRQRIVEAAGCINHFFHVVFEAGFYLSETESWQMIQSGQQFLLNFVALAESTYNMGMCLFAMKPKMHSFAHIIHTALQQFRLDSQSVINPVAESTFMCEDFIGRVSRLSRRVSPKSQGLKTMYRYMVAVHYHLHQQQ